MTSNFAWQQPPTPPTDVADATGVGVHPPRTGRIGSLAELRLRLARAAAFERVPPELYGFDHGVAAWLFKITGFMYRRYFRTECFGLDGLPDGPFLLVANHGSHALSWDGASIVSACLLDAEPPRLVHGMADHRLMELPILGAVARRIGAVDGRRPACLSLLRAGAAVLCFPEGTRAHQRSFKLRYQMAPFRSGFVHVALEANVPIVPVAVIGSEEEAPLLANPAWLRRLMRTPVAPITPTLVVPLPVRHRLHFGAPIRLTGPATPDNVAGGVQQVQSAVESLIAAGLAARPHIFR